MKWPSTLSTWDRRERFLGLCVTAVGVTAGLAPFLGWVALPIAGAVTAIVGAIGRIWITARKGKLENEAEQAKLDRRLRAPIMPVDSTNPCEIGVDPATQTMLPGGEVPAYLPRACDGEVREALRAAVGGSGRWIVALCGSSKVGKSRAMFEALRSCSDPERDILLIAPKDGAALLELLEPGQLPAELDGHRLVVWLDDLETFVADGVGLEALKEWHERAGVVFAVTYGGKGSDRLEHGRSEELAIPTETILQHAAQFTMVRTSVNELDRLPSDLPQASRREIEQHGLPAVMVSGPALERKLTTARHAAGEAECPEGVAVVNAAIDWARCGRTDPIPEVRLRALWPSFLRPGISPSDDGFRRGVEWATRPVSGTIALLQGEEELSAYDYIVSFVDGDPEAAPPEADVWEESIADGDTGQAFSVGVRAALRGFEDHAIKSMEIAATAADPDLQAASHFNLGVLLKEGGDPVSAEAAFVKADEFGLGAASSNLGFLLQEKGDPAGAEAAFRRGAERGNSNGAFNLGLTLEVAGDSKGAIEVFRRAEELGDEDAANNLAVLLEAAGDMAGAEAAFRRADERGSGHAAFNLGLLLKDKNDLEGAEGAFRRAEERGEPGGAVNLGVLLQEGGDLVGAEAAYRRAEQEGDGEAGGFNLGLVLEMTGDPEGAEAAFGRAAGQGSAPAKVKLAVLYLKRGDLGAARKTLNEVAESGPADLREGAEALLEELPLDADRSR